jgi:ADP-ribose pyrophosphatase YjhB (NUDIX family)
MKPATVTDSLLHDLVVSALAEGTDQLAVAAAVTLDDRILLCGHDTNDFDQQWDLPGGAALPGETLTSALDRILACDYGLDTTEIHAYLGSYDRIHHGGPIRTFVFSASCADPLQICRRAWTAHCWADPASLPDQASQELAHLADLAAQAAAPPSGALPGRWQLTAALRACSKGMYCDQAATELLIQHGSWLRRDDFTARFILTGAGPASHIIATINWEEAITALDAGDLPCSSSEAAILGLAASLATASPVVLRHAITGLDQANLYLVINAIRNAGGQN